MRAASLWRWPDHLPLWLFRRVYPLARVVSGEEWPGGAVEARADWSEYQLAFIAYDIVCGKANGFRLSSSAVEAISRCARLGTLDPALAFEDAPAAEYTGTVLGDAGDVIFAPYKSGALVCHQHLGSDPTQN